MTLPPCPAALAGALRRHAPLALAALLGVALLAPAAHAAAPPDSTGALAWARQIGQLRDALGQAEAERDADERARRADALYRDARSLLTGTSDPTFRALLLRAQALYEAHHGGAALPLAPSELLSLRAPLLALLTDEGTLAPSPAALPVSGPAVMDPALAAGPAHLAYPLLAKPLVDRQSDVARRRLGGLQSRMRRYFPQIERTLRRRGVPAELKYVAVIESALNPEAESWAGAQGMWQFMPETQGDFGLDSLTVRDPARSTDAAALYLKRLGRTFRGDWQLALAAYNCGPGRVQRIVRAYQAEHDRYPTFWDIHDALPTETQDYVPRFIAVTALYETPRRR